LSFGLDGAEGGGELEWQKSAPLSSEFWFLFDFSPMPPAESLVRPGAETGADKLIHRVKLSHFLFR